MQELCKEIHRKIDKIDEERYDLQMKVTKSDKEVSLKEPLTPWIFLLWGDGTNNNQTLFQIVHSGLV